jgi:hypothetical protein
VGSTILVQLEILVILEANPGLFSVIYFNKDLKTGKYYITNTDGNGAETGKYHKLVNDLLDSYSEKLNKLSKKEN